MADPASLLARVLTRYGERPDAPVEDIETWTLEHTPYLGKHMRAALTLGEQQGALSVRPTKQDGSKRRKGSFPPGAVIDFTAPTPPTPTQPSLFG